MFSYHFANYAQEVTSVRCGKVATGVRSSNRSRAGSWKQLHVSQIFVNLGLAGRDHF